MSYRHRDVYMLHSPAFLVTPPLRGGAQSRQNATVRHFHDQARIFGSPSLCRRRVSLIRVLPPSSLNKPNEGDESLADDNPAEGSSNESQNDVPLPVTRTVDPVATKRRLLKILTALINLDSQRGKVQQLILELEGLKATPVTEEFTELALAGNWVLLFSSTSARTEGNVRIREIGQDFKLEEKTLTNRVVWTYTSQDRVHHFCANLFVVCSYKFVGPGRLQVTTNEHKVRLLDSPGVENTVPENMEPVILELQRALPIEFFDPSGLLDISYIEPGFRLARFMGKRLAGVRNVFVRPDNDIQGNA